MLNRSLLILIFGAVAIFLAAGTWQLVWPNYRDAATMNHRIVELESKVRNLDRHREAVEKLRDAVQNIHHQLKLDFKEIPDSARLAELVDDLSVPIDRRFVLDQTFRSGSHHPIDVECLEGEVLHCVPLTMKIDATFDTIFDVIRTAEMMPRLIHVSSAQLTCDRKTVAEAYSNGTVAPIVHASIRLEAPFHPNSFEGSP